MTDEQRLASRQMSLEAAKVIIETMLQSMPPNTTGRERSAISRLLRHIGAEPNPDAPLSEIVRRPATDRERLQRTACREYQVDDFKVVYRALGSQPGWEIWEVTSWLGDPIKRFDGKDADADALAHAEQLAEGEG